MGFGFGGFPILFTLMFVLVFGVIVVTLIRMIAQWGKDNASPRLTVEATVVTKRSASSRHRTQDNFSHYTTSYYATFQVESGDRMELQLAGNQFGLLVEGDQGKLTFQGSRFLGFERT